MQRRSISAVLWQNPIKRASIFTFLNAFNSFYRTVTHGESQVIIYKEILLSMVTPCYFFAFEPPNKNHPKQVHVISTAHHLPYIPRNKSRGHEQDTWIQLLITNFLNFNLSQCESNYRRLDLLITTSKISHCSLHFQIIGLWNIHLRLAWASTKPPYYNGV